MKIVSKGSDRVIMIGVRASDARQHQMARKQHDGAILLWALMIIGVFMNVWLVAKSFSADYDAKEVRHDQMPRLSVPCSNEVPTQRR